jgi:hypothetical protein
MMNNESQQSQIESIHAQKRKWLVEVSNGQTYVTSTINHIVSSSSIYRVVDIEITSRKESYKNYIPSK